MNINEAITWMERFRDGEKIQYQFGGNWLPIYAGTSLLNVLQDGRPLRIKPLDLDRALVLALKHCPRDHHDWEELVKIATGSMAKENL